jgi:hypothetical protein
MSPRGWAVPLVAVLGTSSVACGGAAASTAPDEEVVSVAPEATCAGLSALELDQAPMSLLGERLRIRMPTGAVPRADDPARGPQPPVILESVLTLDAGEGRALNVMAMELLRRSEGGLRDEVQRFLRESGQEAEVDALEGLAPGLEGVFVPATEAGFARNGDVARAIVHGEDGVLMNVVFSVSRGMVGFEDSAPCTALARRLAETLTPGARRLELDGGPVSFPHGLVFDLPPSYVGVHYAGPDFEVRYFFPLSPLGSPQAQLGVYVGRDPASHVADVLEIRRMEGTLLERPVEWLFWTSADHGERMHHREAMVELEGAEGEWAHVFLTAPDEETERALSAIVETLRVDAR